MAVRNNTFLIKRSSVPGKVPTTLTLGELALNTADVKLYASGTTSNLILPIGWDRIARTGDTVTGNFYVNGFVSATTISAETIHVNQYIDFYTGNTPSYTTPGRLFYDLGSNSLAYKPNTISGDVTINIGQESVIYVLNNTGVQVNNGQVIHISGSTSGVPTVSLAIASDTVDRALVSGVATHDIPNGGYGFITQFGVVHDIVITGAGVTTDSIVYLSDTEAGGYLFDVSTLSIDARTTKIGRVIATGVTGAILVNIQNEETSLQLTNKQQNIFIGDSVSTGVYEFTGITTASTTTINIAPVYGWIINNTTDPITPTVQHIQFTGATGLSLSSLTTADATYLLLTSALTITQLTSYPTPQQRRQNIYLGKIPHPNRSTIQAVNNQPDHDLSPMSQVRDMFTPIRLINEGITCSPYTGLTIQRSAGVLWGLGIGFTSNKLNPSSVSITGASPATFFYRTMTGGTTGSVSVIDPTKYDLNGVITSVGAAGSDSSTNQRIYQYPTGVINIQYGQTVYGNLASAVAAVQSESFSANSNSRTTGILIGILSVRNDIVADGENLSNTSYARFIPVSKFGENIGGTAGISTTTLQQAYDNSTTPEIATNIILGAVSFKNGTGNADNVTSVIEGVNTAGNVTSFIKADGGFSATSITATTISAATYLNLPTDVYTTGGTYSNGTATFTNITGGSFQVTGFYTGSTDIDSSYLTSATFTNTANTLTFTNVTGGTTNLLIDNLSGLTVNGDINISGTSTTHALIPYQTNTVALGSTAKWWANVHSSELRLYDNSGGENISIKAAPTLGTSPAWSMTMPVISGGVYSLLGVYSGASNTSNTTWFTLSAGTNISLTPSAVASAGTLSISSTDSYTTGVSINNGTLTINRNNNLPNLTADTKITRELIFKSTEMTLNTATRVTITPLVMSVTRFNGTGGVTDAGISFIVPDDYQGEPDFYFTWRAAATGTTSAKTYLDIYTGSTAGTGSIATIAETLSFLNVPIQLNTFLFSRTVRSGLNLSPDIAVHVRIYRDSADVSDTFTGTLDMINFVFKYKSMS